MCIRDSIYLKYLEIKDEIILTNLKEISTLLGQASSRQCGNCKREYQFNNFIQRYPKPYQDQILKLWENLDIRFYCSYCYLLEIIREIKKK